MTISFVTPPSNFLLDSRVFPALGILKVAAMAEHYHYRVEHLDLNGISNYIDAVMSHCRSTESRIFALTATTPQIPAAVRIAQTIKQIFPYARLILGGPHCTLVHASLQRTERAKLSWNQINQLFDIIVVGDGEKAIHAAIETARSTAYGKGVIDADNPQSPMFLKPEDLDRQPLPARHLIDLDSYRYSIDGKSATPLISQLGCPMPCNFCAGRYSPMLRRMRMRSPEQVTMEMIHLHRKYGYTGFMFFDDELNISKSMIGLLKEIVKIQEHLGVEFRCRGFIKAERFTEEQAEWLKRAGFTKLLCGFESGNKRILRSIHKNATREDNENVLEITAKYGIGIKALMSLGHPGESPETIRDTEEWLIRSKIQDFDVTIITAYPGSPYHDDAVCLDPVRGIWAFTAPETGDQMLMQDLDYSVQEDFYKGVPGEYKSYVWTDYLSPEELVEHRDRVEENVREKLHIPFNRSGQPVEFEASYGSLPKSILKKSS